MTLAISAMAVTSSYLAGFPYDNLCQNENAAKANGDGDDDGNAIEDCIGTWDTERIDGSRSMEVTIAAEGGFSHQRSII